MKIGKEVEGRYNGIPTLFILSKVDLDRLCENLELFLCKYRHIRHINIYDPYREIIFDKRIKELSEYYTITVEVRSVPISIPEYIDHLVFQVPYSDFWKLRTHDSIKFVDKNLNVKIICVENMNFTNPKEFEGDIHI